VGWLKYRGDEGWPIAVMDVPRGTRRRNVFEAIRRTKDKRFTHFLTMDSEGYPRFMGVRFYASSKCPEWFFEELGPYPLTLEFDV
jgi:hypothetical protein